MIKPIRVAAVDDHAMILESICAGLADDPMVELVGKGSAGEHVLELVEGCAPDILLLDMGMPQQEGVSQLDNPFYGLSTIAYLQKEYPQVKVLVVSQLDSAVIVEGVLEMGARGYVHKRDVSGMDIPEAIKAVFFGGTYLSQSVRHYLDKPAVARREQGILTPRQQQVMHVVALDPDKPYSAQAELLGISENTLSNHLRNIFEKLGVGNLAAAIMKCVRLGIIQVDAVE